MRKSSILMVLALLTVVLMSPIAEAAQPRERVEIEPWRDGEVYTVGRRDIVVLSWGWAACSKGLVTDFIEEIDQHQYTLDGRRLLGTSRANRLFGPIETSLRFPPERCMWPVPETKESRWEYQLRRLRPGEHTLHMTLSLGYPIIDGGDHDGDGSLDVFVGEHIDSTVTIIVE